MTYKLTGQELGHEETTYTLYHGLHSRPDCLASSKPYRKMPQIDYHPSDARLLPAPLGHPATIVWETQLVPALRRMLDRLSVTRAVLHLVRIERPINSSMGWDPENYLTEIIVWIGVDRDTAPELASGLVAGTLAEVQILGLEDVECEVFTSRTIPLVGPAFRDDAYKYLSDEAQEVAQQFGVGVCLDITPHGSQVQGTGGVFIKLAGRPGTYLLTCQHLLDDDPHAERLIDGPRTGAWVSLCTDSSFGKHLESLTRARRIQEYRLQRHERVLQNASEETGAGCVKELHGRRRGYRKSTRCESHWRLSGVNRTIGYSAKPCRTAQSRSWFLAKRQMVLPRPSRGRNWAGNWIGAWWS